MRRWGGPIFSVPVLNSNVFVWYIWPIWLPRKQDLCLYAVNAWSVSRRKCDHGQLIKGWDRLSERLPRASIWSYAVCSRFFLHACFSLCLTLSVLIHMHVPIHGAMWHGWAQPCFSATLRAINAIVFIKPIQIKISAGQGGRDLEDYWGIQGNWN